MVGQWVGVKLSASLRPTLYQAILPLLQKDEDLVVRIEAANTLKLDILLYNIYVEKMEKNTVCTIITLKIGRL